MPTLADYNEFDGVHWETGTVRNFLAYRGVTAPHTGRPYSEALLLGVSGGIVLGYFTFLYEGYDPMCNILTRNTFDPLDTMLARLGIVQYREQTGKPDKAVAILDETLAGGVPAIVWADMWSLPYNALAEDKGMWAMMPILVYGHDGPAGQAQIADRARVALTVSAAELQAARARVKKDKFRLLTLDPPQPEKLASAVRLGLCDTVKLFTEKPPKGARNNFGLAAYQHWARMLTRPKQRLSWENQFPAGLPLYAGLTSAYNFGFLFGKGTAEDGERSRYADFLEEAAAILGAPSLQDAAGQFRASAGAWQALAQALLPEEIAPLGEARRLMARRHRLFLTQGGAAATEIAAIDERLGAIRAAMTTDFPLEAAGVTALRETLADRILAIHDLEAEAVQTMQAALD